MTTIREIRMEDVRSILTNNGIRIDVNNWVDPSKVLFAKQVLVDNIYVGEIKSPNDILKIKYTGNVLFDSPYMAAVKKYLFSDASPEDKCKAIENETYMISGEREVMPVSELEEHLAFIKELESME